MRRVIPSLIGVLAIAGLTDSAYLALKHLGLLGSEPFVVASACVMAKGPCETAVNSDVGGILGIPAPILGGLYFAAVVVLAIVRIHFGRWLFPYATLAFLAAGLGYSGYLVYKMVAVLDQPCPYCLAAHGINVAAFALYVVSFYTEAISRRVST